MGTEIEQDKTTIFGLRYDKGLKITLAYNENHVQYLNYEKFVEMVTKPDETRVAENFIEPSNGTGGRGQLLGIYDKENSKFVLVRGITGRLIRRNEDVVYRWEFPVVQEDLDIFFNFAKYEIDNKKVLDERISSYGSYIEYDIKLNC